MYARKTSASYDRESLPPGMKKRTTLFFLIDALGWEWIKDTPLLGEAATTRRPLKTVLGFSCSAIPSILTGKFPAEHGRWNLLYYSPQTSPFAWTRYLRFLPEAALESRVGRKAITVISKKASGSEGYFSSYGLSARQLPLFDLSERNNIYRPGAFNGSRSILDVFEELRIAYKVYSYHEFTDEHALAAVQRDVLSGAHNVFFVYLAEIDAFLHAQCHDRRLVAQKINWYEKRIGEIVRTARTHADEVRWFVFSDHGMTPIVKHYDLVGDLARGGVDLAKDCLAVFDSTMARFWPQTERAAARITDILARCPEGRVLGAAELEALKVYFPDGRYGRIIFLMNPGSLIFPNLFGRYRPRGMHGFHPDDAYSDGCYVSNVDEYRPGHITDLYAVMEAEANRLVGRGQEERRRAG